MSAADWTHPLALGGLGALLLLIGLVLGWIARARLRHGRRDR
jgi:hypothetical protein